MVDKHKMIIDGQEVEFFEGQTILQAAENAGIFIPTLCVIDGLTPYGGCRLCLIKVLNDRKPYQTACSTPARPGMEIISKDEELQNIRREIFQMRLSEHPSNCLICVHNQKCEDIQSPLKLCTSCNTFGCFSCSNKFDCQTRKIAEYLEIKDLRFEPEYRMYPVHEDDLFFTRDYNLCVHCGKCVRTCSELRGISAIFMMNRGHETIVSTPQDVPLLESNCIFCGACFDICPTGVFSIKESTNVKRIFENRVSSICAMCGVGCEFDYLISEGKLLEAIPKFQGCVIGRFCLTEFNNSPDRLLEPKIKRRWGHQEVSWDEAFKEIQEKLSKYKPEEIGILASPDLSNESAYVLKKFGQDVIKTKNIATICNQNHMEYYEELSKLNRSFDDIEKAKWIYLINADIQTTHPTLLINLKKAHDNGAKISFFNSTGMSIPNETYHLIDEELSLKNHQIIVRLMEIEEGNGCIFLGLQNARDIICNSMNIAVKYENIQVFPLKGRANLEGVYRTIPKAEDDLLKNIEDGKIKALYTTERIDEKLANKLDYLILQDIFQSDIIDDAQVILPSCSFLEDSGTIFNAEMQRKQFNKCVPYIGESKPDWKIIAELSSYFGTTDLESFEYSEASDLCCSVKLSLKQAEECEICKIIGDLQTRGQEFTIKDFKYRGEYVYDQVEDYRTLVEYRDPTFLPPKFEIEGKEKIQTSYVVTNKERIGDGIYSITISAPDIINSIEVGDFIIIHDKFRSAEIPLLISDVDKKNETINFVFSDKHISARKLTKLEKDDYIYQLEGPFTCNLFIQSDGSVLAGETKYGLEILSPLIKAGQSTGNKFNIILEEVSDNLVYYSNDKFVLCNNYKNVLNKSHILVELDNEFCNCYIREKINSEHSQLKKADGLLLIRSDFVKYSESVDIEILNPTLECLEQTNPGMRDYAIRACKVAVNMSKSLIKNSLSEKARNRNINTPLGIQWNTWDYVWEYDKKWNPKSLLIDPIKQEFCIGKVQIDQTKCNGCGTCALVCPYDAIQYNEQEKEYAFGNMLLAKSEHDPVKCLTCALCVKNCPVNAITMKEWDGE